MAATYKPKSTDIAARAVQSLAENISYKQMKCDQWVEYITRECGGTMDFSGTNDMARNGCSWLGTRAEAAAQGKIVPGAGLLYHKMDGDYADKYKKDGLGNFYHVALYVGEGALTDVDKEGKPRVCNAMHSSENMGRVAGTKLYNKDVSGSVTHVCLFDAFDYGMEQEAPNETDALGDEAMPAPEGGMADGAMPASSGIVMPGSEAKRYVRVVTPGGGTVRIREKHNTSIWKYTVQNNTVLPLTKIRSDGYYEVLVLGKKRLLDKNFAALCDSNGNML